MAVVCFQRRRGKNSKKKRKHGPGRRKKTPKRIQPRIQKRKKKKRKARPVEALPEERIVGQTNVERDVIETLEDPLERSLNQPPPTKIISTPQTLPRERKPGFKSSEELASYLVDNKMKEKIRRLESPTVGPMLPAMREPGEPDYEIADVDQQVLPAPMDLHLPIQRFNERLQKRNNPLFRTPTRDGSY